MQQQPVPAVPAVPDPAGCVSVEQFAKRRRTALWFTTGLFILSVLVLVLGLLTATRSNSVLVSGYYPGIILSFGAFIGIVGIYVVENRRPLLLASIIFISMGVIASFVCAIIDGIIAGQRIDKRPLMEGRCKYYGNKGGYSYNNYYTEVTCPSFNGNCQVRVKSNTCFCCDLFNCASPNLDTYYYEFTEVTSCWDVVHQYRLLWASVVLNVLGHFLGIVTSAILGAFKDISPAPQTCPSPAAPPHILYNPTQHVLTYAGFHPSNQPIPAYPNYPLQMQDHSPYQSPPTTAALQGPEASTSPSDESQLPSQSHSQDSSGYMLNPNMPAFFGTTYGPCEKPPPYAS